MSETYTHGHHESVLRSHEWRTAENSAGYLLDRLEPGMDLLDVGCGPGTITIDLAPASRRARCSGIDRSDEVIAQAAERAATRRARQRPFATGDVYALELEADSFDVVHAHQVLQHLADPVAALRELRRVLRPGGTLAVRDSDYAAFVWAPRDPLLDRWNELYHAITRTTGPKPTPAGTCSAGCSGPGSATSWPAARRGRSRIPSGGRGGGACGPTGSSSRRSPTRRSSTG